MDNQIMKTSDVPAEIPGIPTEVLNMLTATVAVGLRKLLAANLENKPALDDGAMTRTTGVWVEAVVRGWESPPENINDAEEQIRAAFGELLHVRWEWPPPFSLLRILNRPQPGYIPTHEENVARREEERREGEERREADAEHAARYAPQLETPEMLAARLKRARKKWRELREYVQVGHAAAVVRDAKARLTEGRGA